AETTPGGTLSVDSIDFEIKAPGNSPARLKIGIRPRDLSMEAGEGRVAIDVVVESVEFSGTTYIVYAKLGTISIRAEVPRRVEAGAHLSLFLDTARLHFFDPSTGRRIASRKRV
ncbi:MAG TPA: TOBE domain-containing protein, partial [Candidatus Dormibacteraeota bacterium]|nr:TOBE domain-containing protein [Candidatus Dormibacteraeota bacterium]